MKYRPPPTPDGHPRAPPQLRAPACHAAAAFLPLPASESLLPAGDIHGASPPAAHSEAFFFFQDSNRHDK